MGSKTKQFAFLTTILVITIATLAFGIYQNAGNRLGGAIAMPKILWLNFALIAFFVVPGFLAKSHSAFQFVWWSFLIRAVVEGYLLTQTSSWRCWMGISHCLFTLAGFLALTAISSEKRPRDVAAKYFGWLVSGALVVESSMAWLFSTVARPEKGIFFASGEAEFAAINTYTWVVIAIAYPCLAAMILRMMRGGVHGQEIAI